MKLELDTLALVFYGYGVFIVVVMAAAFAFSGSMSQTAASLTSPMSPQARRWFWAKKPQPITAPRSALKGLSRSRPIRRP